MPRNVGKCERVGKNAGGGGIIADAAATPATPTLGKVIVAKSKELKKLDAVATV